MVNPAMQLASKIPDKKLQVWAASLLAGMASPASCVGCYWSTKRALLACQGDFVILNKWSFLC